MNTCHDCGTSIGVGRVRCTGCHRAHRQSVPYRELTLRRDGYACAACFGWWNRVVLWWVAWLWAHTPAWSHVPPKPPPGQPAPARWPWQRVWPVRRVDVDHIVRLADTTGGQDATNWQVLCKRHHSVKTRRENAADRGYRVSWFQLHRRTVTTVLVLTAAVGYTARRAWTDATGALNTPDPDLGTVVGALPWVVALLGLLVLVQVRRKVLARIMHRLRGAVAPRFGVPTTHPRLLRGTRWRVVSIPGLRLPRLRPRRIRGAYPATFADHDPRQRAAVVEALKAKCGGTWLSRWEPAADRFEMLSPDPLAEREPIPAHVLGLARTDLWEPMRVGVREDGRPHYLTLPGRHVLIAGEPESGKSVLLSQLLAHAALDPDVRMYGADGKRVELLPWRPFLEDVAHNPAEFEALLVGLVAQVDARYERMEGDDIEKIARGGDYDLTVLFVDEAAFFMLSPDKKLRDRIAGLLLDYVQRGRAAGFLLVMATQRPSFDIIPTNIRSLISQRVAFRMTDPDSSDIILGRGQAAAGYTASDIDATTRGVGLSLLEGTYPVRFKGGFLDRDQVKALARRAAPARGVVYPGRAVQDPAGEVPAVAGGEGGPGSP